MENRQADRNAAVHAQVTADVQRQQENFARERQRIATERAMLSRPPVSSVAERPQPAVQAPAVQRAPETVALNTPTARSAGWAPPRESTGLNTSATTANAGTAGATQSEAQISGIPMSGLTQPSNAPSRPPATVTPIPTAAPTQTQRDLDAGGPSPATQAPARAANPPAAPARPKPAADPREPDEDGCIDAIGWCSSAPEVTQKGTRTLLTFRNTCPFRVYGTFINGRTDGVRDAGASGVAANGAHTWPTSLGTGKSYVRIVGSTRPSKDWVCAGKYDGFKTGDSTLDTRRKNP